MPRETNRVRRYTAMHYQMPIFVFEINAAWNCVTLCTMRTARAMAVWDVREDESAFC